MPPASGQVAGRGRIRTQWSARSALVPEESLYKWLPGFRLEVA